MTKGQIARLEEALAAAERARERVDRRVYRAMVGSLRSQIEEMETELREYEELERATALDLRSAEELPDVLIRARVARGYTQKDLAERLKLKPQQIQKYEATRYRSASLNRVLEVMRALGLDLQAKIPLKSHR